MTPKTLWKRLRRSSWLAPPGTWTRIERVEHDESYQAFEALFKSYEETATEGLISYKKAFAETETCYLLYRWIRRHKPRVVVETGSYLGLTTSLCAKALAENEAEAGILGRIYSISLNAPYGGVDIPLTRSIRTIRRLGLSRYARFLEGSSVPLDAQESQDERTGRERRKYAAERILSHQGDSLLHKLAAALGAIDLVFLDCNHAESFQISEIAAVMGHLQPHGIIFIDDVLLPDRRADSEYLFRSLVHMDVHLYRMADYVRCGFRFYHAPWPVEAMRWSHLAQVSFYKGGRGFLRIAGIQLLPGYKTKFGMARWHPPSPLKALLRRHAPTAR